ncbi:hypothetical protein [Kitasatospora azatica]|uniref:hypothetical protein n=1 Tax=Kitasatospora azatica TaxID=58347 RepID=UPI00056ADDC0|nr:hypothetical protein [Kitasatospora azatica]
MTTRHRTVADLITTLTAFDPTAPVRLAINPQWPFEHYVGTVTATPGINPTTGPGDTDLTGPDGAPTGVVWIGDGGQIGYLPAEAWLDLHHDPYDDLYGAA